MSVHIVKQGECIKTIAYESGFFWKTIWNHPQNDQLRSRRKNPNVLLPGDRVFVPSKRQKAEPAETGAIHTFRLKGIPIQFKVRLLDWTDRPRPGLHYTLEIDGKKTTGVTPEDGLISQSIAPTAKIAKLVVEKPEQGEELYEFHLGHLNPRDDIAGIQARLKNLGFLKGEPTGLLDDATRQALRTFQAKTGLAETGGEADAATQDALVEAHGS
jgi:N-acetylmuramoyl-L-alanine amidase